MLSLCVYWNRGWYGGLQLYRLGICVQNPIRVWVSVTTTLKLGEDCGFSCMMR